MDFNYEVVFYHPRVWEEDAQINDPNFYPLILNRNDEIISFASFINKTGVFVFPTLPDNSSFIVQFLENVAPSFTPRNVFPYFKSNLTYWV